MIYKIKVPRLGVNEDVVTIVEWFAKEDDYVTVNQAICSIETSKALFEMSAEQNGFLKVRIPEGREVKIQETIGYIADSKDAVIPEETSVTLKEKEPFSFKKEKLTPLNTEILATKKARKLAQKLGVDLKNINKEGLIKKEDVENF
ncbi:biotin/lipoyl-containing protein, partial [Candidatus Omnitrophota bacterium]